ncbi:bacteriohemerythrin [Pseudodesulfovibrio sp. zrk46]|uniref:bacteriohemerythrin n=1 Tax=Pseudodesulfovibrio sp. zrk46 TaxID=2725288 RepID=UPI001449852B|nr:bacteriohemerythrin [Pseudodesulfovibrio sp. zrk46]QJB56308.1 hemerythrin family protein [Pseudodesulfovibrio sp. zrk46]
MAFIDWSSKNRVGITEVDNQHKKLFDLLNSLHQATVNGEEQSALGRILDELVDYTVYHFETEEKLFLEYGYPGYEDHKEVHDDLTRQAVELQEEFREGSVTISFDLLDFLNDWLVTHTTGLDQEMAMFFKGKKID